MTKDQSPAAPVVPDWTVVTAPAARRAVEGILAAGHYDSRLVGLDPTTAWVLAHILRLYAGLGHAPAMEAIAAEAQLPTPSVKEHLARLRERDLVLLGPTGETILGAYPFTEAASGHSVTFRGTGHTLATMCAIDALGAGAMCRDDVTIRSACSACGAAIVACTEHHGMTLKQIAPAGAVVWAGLRASCGCAAETLCTELLFFLQRRASRALALRSRRALFIDRAMAERHQTRGRAIAARGRTALR
jgi:Alkylmercury lyase